MSTLPKSPLCASSFRPIIFSSITKNFNSRFLEYIMLGMYFIIVIVVALNILYFMQTLYIRNKKTKQEYFIYEDGPMGGRYIIYGDSLYISNHYNIYEEDSLRYTFTRYILR